MAPIGHWQLLIGVVQLLTRVLDKVLVSVFLIFPICIFPKTEKASCLTRVGSGGWNLDNVAQKVSIFVKEV